MWIVVVRSWERGAQANAAYVETTYVGPFETEALADAYTPVVDDALQAVVTRAPLTVPVRGPRKVAVLEPPPGVSA